MATWDSFPSVEQSITAAEYDPSPVTTLLSQFISLPSSVTRPA